MTIDDVVPEEEDSRINILKFIFGMIEYDLTPVKTYDKRFNAADVGILIKNNIPSSVANKYPLKYSSADIASLIRNNVTVEQLSEFNPDMCGLGISILVQYGISPRVSFEIVEGYSSYYFAFLHAMGVSNEDMVKKKSLFLNEYFNKNITHYILRAQMTNNLKFYQVGSSGILFENQSVAEGGRKVKILRKYSLDSRKEFDLLFMIESPKNVVNLSYYDRMYRLELGFYDSDGFELEAINGNTLEAICRQGIIDVNLNIKYSHDILNGLIEMRNAGILYHRDIRPANIMIDEENDRAVIIDLGLATTDKDALQVDNRRFGAYNLANDLNSLGQLMYYMATGTHIFSQSESQTTSMSDIANEIADYRTQVYSDNTGKLLRQHLAQVDTTINDNGLRDIIKQCLVAKPDDHDKIMKKFEDYML
jgi:serine/threonine protein kinase